MIYFIAIGQQSYKPTMNITLLMFAGDIHTGHEDDDKGSNTARAFHCLNPVRRRILKIHKTILPIRES